jgi:hypothetical protein
LSYFFPGTALEVQPGPDQFLGQMSQGDAVMIVENNTGMEATFWELYSGEDDFNLDTDCIALGGSIASVGICIRTSSINNQNLIAGMYAYSPS